jgi:hypothetical protein
MNREDDIIGPLPSIYSPIPVVYGWSINTSVFMSWDDRAVLFGDVVHGHPNITDGDTLLTSNLILLVGSGPGDCYARTASRWYRLMHPNPAFADSMKRMGRDIYYPRGLVFRAY